MKGNYVLWEVTRSNLVNAMLQFENKNTQTYRIGEALLQAKSWPFDASADESDQLKLRYTADLKIKQEDHWPCRPVFLNTRV